jgi:hypothetical protein
MFLAGDFKSIRRESMKNVYRVLALLVAAGVVVQAAAIAFGMFGLFKWVENGGTIDQSTSETSNFGGITGFVLHGIVGTIVLPAIALLFLVSSFFAKVPGGVKWALIVFGVAVVQVALGLFSHSLAWLGWLHGGNALILFGVAVSAAMRVRAAAAPAVVRDEPAAASVA